jgi:B-cell receptor-associated protein 31
MLARVFYIVLDFIHVQENYSTLQSKTAKQSGAAGEGEELRKRIRELENELKTSQGQGRDFGEQRSVSSLFEPANIASDTLKKQAAQQNVEYNRLADEHNKSVSLLARR